MTETELKMKGPSELAFVGDAVYELLARERISGGAGGPPSRLHSEAISYVRADAQAAALELLTPSLTEEEADIVRRGKNAHKTAAPRGVSPKTYRAATALEALFGWLYLGGHTQRMRELFDMVASAHDQGENVVD